MGYGIKQSYANKLDKLDETDKFLERHKLLNLTQEETENLNTAITSRDTELVNNIYPQEKAQDQRDSLNSMEHLKN